MSFIINSFSMCKGFCPAEDDSCLLNPSVYFCAFNSTILFLFILLAILKLVVLVIKHRKNFSLVSFQETFQQSIFSYLQKESPKKSYFLYLTLAYGVFFFRPLGFVLFNFLITGALSNISANWKIFIAALINSVTSTMYFFSVIFMVNFYGVKAEILTSKGDLSISPQERELFLKMVLKRTQMFSITFFFGTMLEASFLDSPFDIPGIDSYPKYQWTVRTISYSFVAILLVNRLYYVKYAKKMMIDHTVRKNKMYSVISFKKHLENHTLTKEMLPGLLDGIKSKDDAEFIDEVQKVIVQKCGRSSFLFDDTLKIINGSKSFYQPILRNSMENHLAGTLWLFFTLFDTMCNSLTSSMMGLFYIINPESDPTSWFPIILTFIMFGLYALETTLQPLLAHLVVTSKGNFGEYLEVDSSLSESSDYDHPFVRSEVTDNNLNRSVPFVTVETMIPDDGLKSLH